MFAQDIILNVYNTYMANTDRVGFVINTVAIHGIVALPFRQGSAPMSRVSQTFPRTYPRATAPARTRLIWDDPVATGAIDPSVLRKYMTEDRLDSRHVASTMALTMQ